jgi:hypothetical protein
MSTRIEPYRVPQHVEIWDGLSRESGRIKKSVLV